MRNTEVREIVPNPEDNQAIQALVHTMASAVADWHHTSFKAVPKETVAAHNIKW